MTAIVKSHIVCEKRRFGLYGLSAADMMVRNWRRLRRFYELDILQYIRRKEIPGCYIDGGANYGNHSIFFANFCPATSVIAVESHPQIFAVLNKNVTENPCDVPIVTTNCALSSEPQQTAKLGTINPRNVGATTVDLTQQTADGVPTTTIDALCQEQSQVAVIKLDIEGCELAALQGGKQTLHTHRPYVIAEAKTPQDIRDITELLEPLHYQRTFQTKKNPPSFVWEPV